MLIKAITDHFNDYFSHSERHDTVLWFDPGREYAALLVHLTDVPLLRYQLIQPQQIELAVVYLPMEKEAAEILRPFFHELNFLFRTRLYKPLRQQGLDFPDDPQIAHQMRELLPQLAARSIDKGSTLWDEVLQNLERIISVLVGDLDNAVLRYLAAMRHASEHWAEDGRLAALVAAAVEHDHT